MSDDSHEDGATKQVDRGALEKALNQSVGGVDVMRRVNAAIGEEDLVKGTTKVDRGAVARYLESGEYPVAQAKADEVEEAEAGEPSTEQPVSDTRDLGPRPTPTPTPTPAPVVSRTTPPVDNTDSRSRPVHVDLPGNKDGSKPTSMLTWVFLIALIGTGVGVALALMLEFLN